MLAGALSGIEMGLSVHGIGTPGGVEVALAYLAESSTPAGKVLAAT